MAFLTTNPNPYIINVPELQNVITSATGAGTLTQLSNSMTEVLTNLDPATSALSIATISAITGTSVSFRNDINLSNASLLWNGVPLLTSNALSGTQRLSLQVDRIEKAYLASNGDLYVSGDVYANGVHYPSDARLKRDVRPYAAPAVLPTPIEFTWTSNGARDIGVLADDVRALEPACVDADSRGFLRVDYAKLVTVCLAELGRVRGELSTVQHRLAALEAATNGS